MYIVNGLMKFVEEDIFNDGCQPDTAQTSTVDISVKAETVSELIDKLSGFLVIKDFQINPCEDDTARIEFQCMEDGDNWWGATASEIELWKAGKLKLYRATYTAIINQITPIDINKALKAES